MLKAFFNIWKVSELRMKLLFTLSMLAIYRIGFRIPLPGVDQTELKEVMGKLTEGEGGGGDLVQYMSIFSGGSLEQSTIFGLGIMPYISASIIFQLLATAVPSLQALKKEPGGHRKIQEYTRLATLGLCVVQAIMWLSYLNGGQDPLVYPDFVNSWKFWVPGVMGLTCGTMFLMWLGEQIDKYGIGNGISLLITAGILAGMHQAIGQIADNFSMNPQDNAKYSLNTIIWLIIAFVVVVAGAIVITQGQRRIPIQHAKHTRGRRVYGGQKSHLPLRVNHGGVMPIIFASSLMIFPSIIFSSLRNPTSGTFLEGIVRFLDHNFSMQNSGFLYVLFYIAMIYFFSYFWTTVQFQPKEMADNLRTQGHFIPGMRPGPRTATYLESVMERITYVGAGFLAVIAVIPTLVTKYFNIPYNITAFLGGTGLLICVSVMLDFVQRIEANLMMRNYDSFLGGKKGIRGARS